MDVYNLGRNMKEDDGSYNSIHNMSNPRNQQALEIYNTFVNSGVNKTGLTYSSIEGIDEFRTLSPLATSAAASLSLAAIDLHFIILDNMYEAINMCNDLKEGWGDHWDIAVAVVVGWAEGVQQGGSELDGYLIFNVAQQLCARFDSCDSNGNSVINIKIIEEFKNGQELLKNSLCDDAKVSAEAVETLLQTILVDNLAYRSKFSNVTGDEANLLLAFTTANALIPLMRSLDEESANTLESNLGTFPLDEFSVGEVLSALKQYVHVKGIDCSLLGSSICDYMSSVSDGTIVIEPNNSGHTLADGEYTPITNVESISSLSSVLSAICSAESIDDAKSIFSNNNTAGLTIESMSLNAKSDEILFNQYVSALSDGVDKIEGSFLFDGKPAVEYANTITMDAFDTSVALGKYFENTMSVSLSFIF